MIQNSNSNTCIIIPARLDSLRFPNKVMWNFMGIPMIEHVYKRASMALDPEHIFVTSGDFEILNYMQSIGANVIPSKLSHTDGTSRAAEAAKELIYEKVIVLQADEILIDPEHLKQLFISIQERSEYNFWNLITNLGSNLEIKDPNIVKCVLNIRKEIFFIFRKNPFLNSNLELFKKIMGTIAFRRVNLISLREMSDLPLHVASSIEQLKMIEYGGSIAGIEVESSYPSINTQFDIKLVKDHIRNSDKQKKILGKYVNI